MNRKVALALLMMTVALPAYAGDSAVPVGATEVTQLANHAELISLGLQQAQMIIQQVQTAQSTLRSIQSYKDMDWHSAENALTDLYDASQQARGISYTMQNIDESFQEAYPTYHPPQDFTSAYQNWTDDTMEGLKASLRAANIQNSQFNSENLALHYLSSLSDNATGQTQAVQAGNAIAGQIIVQMQKMRQLQMAQLNAQNAYMAHQVNTQAADKAAFENQIHEYQPEGNNESY